LSLRREAQRASAPSLRGRAAETRPNPCSDFSLRYVPRSQN